MDLVSGEEAEGMDEGEMITAQKEPVKAVVELAEVSEEVVDAVDVIVKADVTEAVDSVVAMGEDAAKEDSVKVHQAASSTLQMKACSD